MIDYLSLIVEKYRVTVPYFSGPLQSGALSPANCCPPPDVQTLCCGDVLTPGRLWAWFLGTGFPPYRCCNTPIFDPSFTIDYNAISGTWQGAGGVNYCPDLSATLEYVCNPASDLGEYVTLSGGCGSVSVPANSAFSTCDPFVHYFPFTFADLALCFDICGDGNPGISPTDVVLQVLLTG